MTKPDFLGLVPSMVQAHAVLVFFDFVAQT